MRVMSRGEIRQQKVPFDDPGPRADRRGAMMNTCSAECLDDALASSSRFTRVQFECSDSATEISDGRRNVEAAESGDETARSFHDEGAIATGRFEQSSFGKIGVFFPPDGVENPADNDRFRVDSTSAMQRLDCRCQRLRSRVALRLTIHSRILYGEERSVK